MALFATTLAFGLFVWQLRGFQQSQDEAVHVSLLNTAVSRYGVVEFDIQHGESPYANVWEGPSISVFLTSPSDSQFNIGGFYHSKNLWKARFAPREIGTWRWALEWHDGRGNQVTQGTFDVNPGDPGAAKGPVRRHRENPFRLVFEEGSLYPAIGIGDCIPGPNADPAKLHWGLDGEMRAGHHDGSNVDIDTYLNAYSQAGFNLFRWSVDNCAFKLWERIDSTGNVYLEEEGKFGDTLVTKLRNYGFRVYMTIFNRPAYPAASADSAKMGAVKRYAKYVVDRYGAYVDFWELMNESSADDNWYSIVANYIRSVDPYNHLISTSNPRPDLTVIEINSPHWYQKEDEFSSDVATANQIQLAKAAARKPVIFGEQGNSVQNWDERSALRMRIRSWTAFFNEGIFIFWNSSFAKDYAKDYSANIYLGPLERSYIRNLQTFTSAVDSDVRIAPISVAPATEIRAYALGSSRTLAAYLHNYKDHNGRTTGATMQVTLPSGGFVFWYRPDTGHVLPRFTLQAGFHKLAVPAFVTDIALIVNGSFSETPPLDH